MSFNRSRKTQSLDEVKGIISALLVARKHSSGVPVTQLDQDYREEEGIRIPFRDFNFPTLIDFLESLRETLIVSERYGGHVVYPIVNEKIKHVSALVAGQRQPGRKSMRGRRPMGRSRSCYSTPMYYPPRRLHSRLLSDVVKLVQMNPEGIEMHRVLQFVRDKMMDNNYELQFLLNQIREIPHEIKIDGNILYAAKRWPHDRFVVENRVNSGYERREGIESFDKQQASNFRVAPSAQNSSGSGNHISHSNIRMAGSSASEDECGFELVSPAAEAFVTEKMKEMEKISEYHSSKIDSNSLKNEKKEEEEDKIESNAKDETKKDTNSDYSENIGALIGERTRFRLEKLVQNRPEGIWCAELPSLYYKEYGIKLNYEDLGFYSVSDYASYLPDIFHCVQPQELGDIKLFDAKATKPSIKQRERPKKTLTLADLHNIYGDDMNDKEALPLVVSPEISCRLFPDGAMRIGETVAQISVGNITKGVNEFISVIVVEIFTPSFFWIHLFERTSKFKKFMADLHTFYENQGNKYMIPLVILEKGLNCACKYADVWHRGIIKSVAPDHTVTVMFYDYGTIKSYPPQEIHFLHRLWSSLPAQAIPCGLYNVRPVGTSRWPQSASYEFADQVRDIPLIATIAKKDDDNNSMLIGLTNTHGTDDFHINDWMVETGLAVYGKMGDTVDMNDRCIADPDPVGPHNAEETKEFPRKNGSPNSTDPNAVVREINCFLFAETNLPIDAITSNGSTRNDPEKTLNILNMELLKAYIELKKKHENYTKSEESNAVDISSAKNNTTDNSSPCRSNQTNLTNEFTDSKLEKEESAVLIDLRTSPVSKTPQTPNYFGNIDYLVSNSGQNLLSTDCEDICNNSLPNSQLPLPLTPISSYAKNEQVSSATEANTFDPSLSQSNSNFSWKEHAGLLYEEPLPMNNDETIESARTVLSPIAETPTVAQKICAWGVANSNDSQEFQRKIIESIKSKNREQFQDSVAQTAKNFFERMQTKEEQKSTTVSQSAVRETNPFKVNFHGAFEEELSTFPPPLPARTTLGKAINETKDESSSSLMPRIIYEAEPVIYDAVVKNQEHNVPANAEASSFKKYREEKINPNKNYDTQSTSASSSVLRPDCNEFVPGKRINVTYNIPPGFQVKDRDFILENKINPSPSVPPRFSDKNQEINRQNDVKTTCSVPPGHRIEPNEFIATKQNNVASWLAKAQSFFDFYGNSQGNVEVTNNLVTNGQSLASSGSARSTNVTNSTSSSSFLLQNGRNGPPPPLPPRTYLKSKIQSKSSDNSGQKTMETTSNLQVKSSESSKNVESLRETSLKSCATSKNGNDTKTRINEKSIIPIEEELENFKLVELSKGTIHLIYLNNEGWITMEEFVEMFTILENPTLLIGILKLKGITAPFHVLSRSDDPALFEKLDRTWLKVNRDETLKIKGFLRLIRIKSCLTILQKLRIIRSNEVHRALAEEIFPENRVLVDMWTLINAVGDYKLRRSKISVR